MKVLITGVAGHLGSQLARWIIENKPGVEIVGVDNLSCGYQENVPAGVDFRLLDLLNAPADLAADCEYVFHFAAYAAECLSPFVRRYNIRNNWEATAAVLNSTLNAGCCKRFVFTSSMAAYGNAGSPPFDESAECRPIDPYGIAKRACELDLKSAGEQHGLPYTIIRPHNLYGPGQSIWQRYRNVLGLWMRAAIEGKPIRVYGDGMQQRAFSYVEDCLPCLWRAAESPSTNGETINLGGAVPTTIREAAEIVSEVTGQREIVHLEPRHEVRRAYCTVEKSRKLLGFRESTSLRGGIERMWAWAQEAWGEHPLRRAPHPSFEYEVERGIYDYWKEPPCKSSTGPASIAA